MSIDNTHQSDLRTSEQLFILGAPRSGTTFLASLLDTTRYGKPVESHFITKYYPRLHHYGNLNILTNFEKLVGDISRERAVMQWHLDLDAAQLHDQLLERAEHVQYADLIDLLFQTRRDVEERHAWGDKTPHYLGNVDVIDQLFPKARYLYIVRDGRDVALSLLRKDWGPNNLYAAAEYWVRLNRISPTLERLAAAGQLYFLRYEDLSLNVEHHVREISKFLNENISEDDIIRLAETVRNDNSYKWKKTLPQRKVALFESVAHDTLMRFNYEVAPQVVFVSPIRRNAYLLHDRLVWLGFMFKTNVIHGLQIRFLGKEPFAD